jgi:hypothetical protein
MQMLEDEINRRKRAEVKKARNEHAIQTVYGVLEVSVIQNILHIVLQEHIEDIQMDISSREIIQEVNSIFVVLITITNRLYMILSSIYVGRRWQMQSNERRSSSKIHLGRKNNCIEVQHLPENYLCELLKLSC